MFRSPPFVSPLNAQPDDGRSVVAEARELFRRGGLGHDFEQAIIFARRLWEEQTFQRRTGRQVLPTLFLRGFVLFAEARDLRHDDIHRALAPDPITAALLLGRPGEDRAVIRLQEFPARPLQEYADLSARFDCAWPLGLEEK